MESARSVTNAVRKDMKLRKLIHLIFKRIAGLFWGSGIGKLPLANGLYMFLQRKLKPKDSAYIEVEGCTIYFDPWDIRDSQFLAFGTYNEPVTELFKQEITPGMIVADLGAHVGYYTVLASKLVGAHGKVFAFEPAPDNFTLLTKNISANNLLNVAALQKAVSNKEVTTRLVLQDSYGHFLSEKQPRGSAVIEVNSISLDRFFEEKDIVFDFIKMNIEGYEMAALEGMPRIVKRSPHLKLITEFCPEFLIRAGFSPEEFLKTLLGHGFNIYDIKKDLDITENGVHSILAEYNKKGALTFLFCQRR